MWNIILILLQQNIDYIICAHLAIVYNYYIIVMIIIVGFYIL